MSLRKWNRSVKKVCIDSVVWWEVPEGNDKSDSKSEGGNATWCGKGYDIYHPFPGGERGG